MTPAIGDVAKMKAGAADAERRDLRRKRLLVVDDMMRAHVLRPLHGLGPRCGRYDGKIGQLPRQLDGDRADAARAAKNEDRARRAGNGFGDIEPVEHRLPGGDRRQRQSGGGGEVERARLAADDPLVDQMKLHVSAQAADAAGVEHFVARLEEAGVAADFRDDPGRVVADDLDCVRLGDARPDRRRSRLCSRRD